MDKPKEEGQVAVVAETKPKRPSLRKGEKAAKSPETGASTVAKKASAKPVAASQEAPKVEAKVSKAKPKADKKAEPVFVAKLAVKGKPIFALDEPSRPRSGRLLLAHTHAALSILGLLSESRPAIPKSSLLTMVGQRAVKYHTENGNLESAPDNGIRLSVKGYNTFKTRHIDADAATAFQDVFLTGKPNAAINVKQPNVYQTKLG